MRLHFAATDSRSRCDIWISSDENHEPSSFRERESPASPEVDEGARRDGSPAGDDVALRRQRHCDCSVGQRRVQ